MAEKRNSTYVWLLRNHRKDGGSIKIELFSAELWGDEPGQYRVRIDGKWHGEKNGAREYFNKDEFKEVLFGSLDF